MAKPPATAKVGQKAQKTAKGPNITSQIAEKVLGKGRRDKKQLDFESYKKDIESQIADLTSQIEELTKTNSADQKTMRRLKNHIAACNHRLNTRTKLEEQKSRMETEDMRFKQAMRIVREELNESQFKRIVKRL